MTLFKRHIIKERFGNNDAVDFLKEKTKVQAITSKMEKLHKVVVDVHEGRRQKAQTCGMNTKRKADLAKIIADSAEPEESVHVIANTESTDIMTSASSGID